MWDSSRFISNLLFELFLCKDKSLRRKLAVVLTLSQGRGQQCNAELASLVCHFVCKSFSVYYFHDDWSWLIPNTLLILHLILVDLVINNGFGSLVLFFNLYSLFIHGCCIQAYKCVCSRPNNINLCLVLKAFNGQLSGYSIILNNSQLQWNKCLIYYIRHLFRCYRCFYAWWFIWKKNKRN